MKLCDICRTNPAAVHVAHIAGGKMSKQHLCETCARQSESGLDDVAQSFLTHLHQSDDGTNFSAIDANAIEQIFSDSLDLPPDEMAELVAEVQSMLGEAMDMDDESAGENEEFDDGIFAIDADENFFDGDTGDDLEEFEEEDESESSLEEPSLEEFLSEGFSPVNDAAPAPGVLPASGPREVYSARCEKCGTTWDRLREDGRAGCAYCYEAFEDRLRDVMERMQRGAAHIGKAPRAAVRRRRRLEQLRDKRDHRLQMLQNRLQEAIAKENYEDAAALRDKIKMVSSTIVNDEG